MEERIEGITKENAPFVVITQTNGDESLTIDIKDGHIVAYGSLPFDEAAKVFFKEMDTYLQEHLKDTYIKKSD